MARITHIMALWDAMVSLRVMSIDVGEHVGVAWTLLHICLCNREKQLLIIKINLIITKTNARCFKLRSAITRAVIIGYKHVAHTNRLSLKRLASRFG